MYGADGGAKYVFHLPLVDGVGLRAVGTKAPAAYEAGRGPITHNIRMLSIKFEACDYIAMGEVRLFSSGFLQV